MSSARQREAREEREISARKWADDQGKFDRPYIKIPAGMKQFRPEKDKEYVLDIIPFIAGEGNPRADKGMPHWERTFRVHKNVGPSQKTYLCIADASSKPCAPCSERIRLRDKGASKEEMRAFNSSERQLFLVRLKGTKEIMLWDESTWCFGKYLKAALDRKEGKFDMFADPNKGYSLEIGTKEETMAGGKGYVICPNINFVKREKQIGSSIYDKAPCLDDMLVVLSPKEMEDLFFQTADAEDDADDEKPVKKNKKHQEEDEDEDTVTDSEDDDENDSELEPEDESEDDEDSETEEDSNEDDEPAPKKKSKKEKTAKECGLKVKMMVEHPKFGECEITKISPDGTSLTLEDEDGDKHMAVGPEEVEIIGKETDEDSDEDDEPAPPKKKKKPDPVDEDDDSDEPEDSSDTEPDDEDSYDLESDEEDEPIDDEDSDYESEDPDDEEDERPTRKPVKKTTKPVKKPSRR